MAALESGTIDVATYVKPKDVKPFENNPKFQVGEELKSGIGNYVQINTENEILQDVQVRKALSVAINKEAVIQSVLQGEGVVAHGPLPASMPDYDQAVEEYGYKYNLDEAKKQLEAAGWRENGQGVREKNGKKLSLRLSIESPDKQSAQLLQAMLAEAGVEIKIEELEYATLLDKSAKGDYDLAINGYTYADPDILYLFFHSSQVNGGINYGKVQNRELDALLEKGRTTMDLEARKKIYADVQKIIVDQAYWIPIYTEKMFHVMNSHVKGVKVAAGRWYLNDLEKTE